MEPTTVSSSQCSGSSLHIHDASGQSRRLNAYCGTTQSFYRTNPRGSDRSFLAVRLHALTKEVAALSSLSMFLGSCELLEQKDCLNSPLFVFLTKLEQNHRREKHDAFGIFISGLCTDAEVGAEMC